MRDNLQTSEVTEFRKPMKSGKKMKSGKRPYMPGFDKYLNPHSTVAELDLVNMAMKEEYLDKEKELELFRAWKEHGDEKARSRLIMSHLRISVSQVSKMKHNYGTENDLIQETVLALMHALDKFDPDKGFRLSTYVRHWIRAGIQDTIMRDATVRMKATAINRRAFFTLGHIDRASETNLRNQGKDPGKEEISEETARMMSLDPARLSEIRLMMPSTSSLNLPITNGDEENGEEIESLLVSEAPTPEETCISNNSAEVAANALEKAFSVLDERETRIIKSRSMSLNPVTLEVLGDEFGISRERIRQVEARALKKLRKKLAQMGIRNPGFITAVR